jgi:ribose transport system permease protein
MSTLTKGLRGSTRDWDLAARLGLSLVIIIGFALVVPRFLSTNNVFSVLQVVAPIGIAALGVGVTMLAGEFDLSIGSMAAVGGVASILLAGNGPVISILVPMLIGALLGAGQGALISKLKISSLVVTIGTLILLRGLAYVLSGEKSVFLTDFGIGKALSQRIWVFSPLSLVFIILVFIVWIVLRYTKFGHEVYAMGGGRREAQAAGLSPFRPLVTVFAFSGSMGALAGALVSLSIGGAAPTAFSEILLSSVAAAVIGGIALSGGKGSPWGLVLGAVALGVISNGVSVLGAPVYVLQFLTGGLLLAALAAEMLTSRSPRVRKVRAAARSSLASMNGKAAKIGPQKFNERSTK